MTRPILLSPDNGAERNRFEANVVYVMGAVITIRFAVRSFTHDITVAMGDVRDRNPEARFLTAVPVKVSVALLLLNIGFVSGIGLVCFMVFDRPRLASYPGRLLWHGFCLNFVAFAMIFLSYLLIEYASFMS